MAIRDFISKGLRFECTACGKCCVNHGDYELVFLTDQDICRAAGALKLGRKEFLKRYTRRVHGERVLQDRGDRCVFLDPDGLCRIYEARPLQCRTFPFWKENLNPRTWNGTIARDCPGVGRGRPVSRSQIELFLRWEQEGCYPVQEKAPAPPGRISKSK